MPLPITPTYSGKSNAFMQRMQVMHQALPVMFERLDKLGLRKAYSGLKGIRFVESPERGSSTLAHYDKSSDTISIYPMLFRSGMRVDVSFYSGLGLRHWEHNVSSAQKNCWRNKLVYPNVAVIDRLQEYFQHGIQSYKDVLDRFTSSVDRLQVIHIINTLIDNSINYYATRTLDLKEYPPTKDFCKGLKPFSITPLLSVYRNSTGLGLKYEDLFSEYCVENGKLHASETSVQYELVELFAYCSGI
jgi:hypothetical protein